jgi:hypothetical protein
MESVTSDRGGRPVRAGTRVRLLEIASFLKRDLPGDEVRELEAMVGEIFDVHEVDEDGKAWIEKTWQDGQGGLHSHSLALAAHEMEVVA